MSRDWTKQKRTTLCESALDPSKHNSACPLHRADLDEFAALKRTLGAFAVFAFVWLPIHGAIYWLSIQSVGLAAGGVVLLVAAIFVIATAKWLGLDDVLQKLPLVFVLAAVFLGIGFLLSSPNFTRWTGSEYFGTILIIITAVSLLGGLYRPISAVYQTATTRIPFRDLCITAAALVGSLGVAAVAVSVNCIVFTLLTSVIVGIYAGLIVIEYAAWARSNPERGLMWSLTFVAPEVDEDGETKWVDPVGDVKTPIFGAALMSLGFTIVGVFVGITFMPSPELCRLVARMADQEKENPNELLQGFFLFGVYALAIGFYLVGSSLHALKWADPSVAMRRVWNALFIFLTYPDAAHPLVHKCRIPWLRPVSVRLAISGIVLITIATGAFLPTDAPSPKNQSEKPVAKALPPSPTPPLFGFHDAEAERILNSRRDGWPQPRVEPAVPAAPNATVESNGLPMRLAVMIVSAVIGPPILIWVTVWLVGLTVLPTYFNYFETPEPMKTKSENESGKKETKK